MVLSAMPAAESPPVFKSAVLALAFLERRWDGPLPAEALAAALAGGSEAAAAAQTRGLIALHQRLAAEARLGLVRRRREIAASGLGTDPWLERLSTGLAAHRAAALDCHVNLSKSSCLPPIG